jgi:hypothetical protein
MKIPNPFPKFARAGLACAALLLAVSAHAADEGFCENLSPQESASAGVSRLTGDQVAALDALVSHDTTLARQGGVTAFASAFLARHTESERASAGLDSLSDKESAALDRIVARTIALGPPPEQPFAYSPPKAKPAPSPSKLQVSAPLRAEVHGDLSLTVGGGSHGRSFYGTSADLSVTDPTGRFTVGVGFEEFKGKGLLGLYGPYGPYSLYGPVGPPYLAPYWGP